jgi:hypothetical protein
MRTLLCALALVVTAQPMAASAPGGGVVRVEHRDPSGLPVRGPSNALVTIEVFFSPGASTRAQVYRLLEKLQSDHPSRIRLVYRVVKTGGSVRIPVAALFAHAEGKFFQLIDAVNNARLTLNDKELSEVAKQIGLDADRMLAVISKPPAAYEAALAANERRRRQRLRGDPQLPNILFNGRAPDGSAGALGLAQLEKEYKAARELAEDLVDRGADPRSLSGAFDVVPVPGAEIIVQPGPTDNGDDAGDPVLASPALDVAGLPSYGPVEATTTIIVACSPTSSNCRSPMLNAEAIRNRYPDRVRLVWAPFFDVSHEDAADKSLLADAALCAERDGGRILDDRSESFDPEASPGWRWIQAMLEESRGRMRNSAPDKIIDRVTEKLRVDRRALATCRAQLAGATIAWIETARHAGLRVTPSTIVGGRIYGPINDSQTLQLLVEAELAPGMLGEAAPSWLPR